MSEAADLNREPDFEQMLRESTPERLEVSRDELFFQAGYAAGARIRSRQFVWPAIAAVLLVACGGITAVMLHERSEFQSAMAAAEIAHSTIAVAKDASAKPQAVIAVGDRALSNERLRDFRRLVSTAPLPPGRLTAGGWEEARAEVGNGEWGMGNGRERSGDADSKLPRRPATYLELLHRYQEG